MFHVNGTRKCEICGKVFNRISYNQRRTWDLNYAVLRNIYHALRNHKIDEWHTLCDWIETLPYAKELICG